MIIEKHQIQAYLKRILSMGMLLFITLVISNCQDVKKHEIPANLISKEMMVEILTDCYINNAARSINLVKLKDSKIKLDSMIYRKYHIDSTQFAESNAYYSLEFKVYTDILSKVEVRLLEIQKRTDSIVKNEKKNDSILTDQNLLIDSVESSSIQDSIE